METKTCPICSQHLPVTSFYVRNKERKTYSAYCKSCWSTRHKEYYAKNKAYYKAKSRRQSNEVAALLFEAKDRPCFDCGKRYPHFVMDFDHRDGDSKIDNVSTLAFSGSRKKFLEEIVKCDVVCANCHRIRTHARK